MSSCQSKGTIQIQDGDESLADVNGSCNCVKNQMSSLSLKEMKNRIISFQSYVAKKKKESIRTRALANATKLHRRALNPENAREKCLVFDYFVSAMKIRERYAPNTPILATSFTSVGLAILDRDLLNSETYSKVALKCLCAALTILKTCYVQQKNSVIIPGNRKITHLDLAKAGCNVARAYLQLDDIDAALEQAFYSLRIIGVSESQKLSLDRRNRNNRKVMALCCTMVGKILAIRMEDQLEDKTKAIKWFRLAIKIQEHNATAEPLALATSLTDLAFFLHDIGDCTGALQLYERALEIRSKRFRRLRKGKKRDYENLANMCHILNNTALVFRSMGRLDKAHICLKRALDSLPPDSSQMEVAYIAGNLSRLTLEFID
mmetsp:Transcript_14782/g.21806  ORF Transcript_14782/g.21806 Transcript_14782/m.21806 type:complete len:377 (-) Transcript_14782:162-1292(-)|eukprot:CAMPEP_0194212136 /NCGR_PEP_ID=MMETSP0156-20130528/11802_1 /TAXON_ID=33649 /ORGANISM="Thalassionema nitzschioides, Strain L26-B" /LENGTH=376 /DNA_ID=CAMNT_0038939883 /DNA_START=209 /DNA_END=1339 /DNA_ORIENTATION=-